MVQTNSTDAEGARPINMSNIDMMNLIERLESILSILDEQGHPIAAIKIEEAINILRQAEGGSEETDE